MAGDPHYKTAKHLRWREKVLRGAGYLCQECGRYGKRTEATHAHHKLPRQEYPELQYDARNGMALCAACHNKAHPEKGGRNSV